MQCGKVVSGRRTLAVGSRIVYALATINDVPDAEPVVHFSAFLMRKKIGTATLVMYRTDTQLCARLEDVEIVASERGKGYGARLVTRAREFLDEHAANVGEPIHLHGW